MNQPRYSDDNNGSGNSWQGNGSRRSVAHSTGRSNYGGSSRPRGKKEKGPIGNWIKNRRERRRQRQRSSNNNASGGMAVGTEANAIQNMNKNAKNFAYPTDGFITPIEHSLLYAMIEFPERYPESVVKSEIEEEEFEVYLYVNDTKRRGNISGGGSQAQEKEEEGSDREAEFQITAPPGKLGIILSGDMDENGSTHVCEISNDSVLWGKVKVGDTFVSINGEDVTQMNTEEITNVMTRTAADERALIVRRRSAKEGSDQATASAPSSSRLYCDEEERVSYAQLSALAALSAEKNPSTATSEETNASTTTKTSASSTNGNASSSRQNSANNSWMTGTGNTPKTNNLAIDEPKTLSIGQTLVRKLLRTITRYSDAHSLDRQNEIREFLAPIERRCQLRNEKAALQQLLPAYAGYTISLMTGNPLPLLIGAAALTQPDPMMDENSNVSGFRAVGGRAGDMETAGLLDECESD